MLKVNSIKIKLGYVVGLGLALVVGSATTAAVMAAIPDSGGVIHGCYKSTGALSVIDNATQSCAGNETALNWNQTGPAGATGATGATGPAGPAGASVGYAGVVFPETVASLNPNNTSTNVTLLGYVPFSAVYASYGSGGLVCLRVNTPALHGAVIGTESLNNDSDGNAFYKVATDGYFDSYYSNIGTCPSGTNVKVLMSDGNGSVNLLFY